MNFYVVLGLGPQASLDEVKRAYKRLARKFHPDINPGDRLAADQFRRIAEAYETLSDPDRRRQYDIGGPPPAAGTADGFGFEGFDFSVSVTGMAAPTFGDLFADVLRERLTRREPQRGQDLHQSVALTFEDAMRGGERRLTLTRRAACRACGGRGTQAVAEGRCAACQGTGVHKSTRGHMVFSKPCAQCRGTGHRAELRCQACGGQQVERRTESLPVVLPPGLASGARVRVAGQGDAGLNGGPHGDLYLTAVVEPHPRFRREGDDLHLIVPVAVHEAALGAKIEVPTLDGVARLRVPPGTQSGQRFRLRGRGVPGETPGDLVVEVRLVLPRLLDERSKELLREFGRLNQEDVRVTEPS
jgi:molecular chaperone DnaJ